MILKDLMQNEYINFKLTNFKFILLKIFNIYKNLNSNFFVILNVLF